MTDLTEKLKELLMGCDCHIGWNEYYFNSTHNTSSMSDHFASRIAKQLAPEIEKMLPRWIPVGERLPENGDWVFFVRSGKVYRGQRQQDRFECDYHRYFDHNHDVTDWMYSITPLPPTPKGPMG